jgi:hypothetical protein
VLIPAVPLGIVLALPMRRREVAAKTDPVGDAFDETARTRAEAVVLETMDHLVGEDAGNFGGDTILGLAGNVAEGEVDLLVVVVQVRPLGEGHAAHVAQNKRHGAGGWQSGSRARRRMVEEAEDVADREGGAVRGVDCIEVPESRRMAKVANLKAQLGQLEQGTPESLRIRVEPGLLLCLVMLLERPLLLLLR